MKAFEFAKATDITEYAKERFAFMYKEYEKVYIVPDTNDYHILRILGGYNEDYEKEDGVWLLEENLIPKQKGEGVSSLRQLHSILMKDDGGNYDFIVRHCIDDCIEKVDGGFGINVL